jgi:hypothetical protein
VGIAAILAIMCAAILAPSRALAAGLPDLSISRGGPSTVAVGAPFTETLTVANQGTAATAGVQVTYAPGTPAVSGGSPGVSCAPIVRGHSGRGGGYTRVGWTCTETVAGGLAPGGSTTLSLIVYQSTVATLAETFAVAPSPASAQLNIVSHTTSASVTVFRPPAPAAPTGVTANQVLDQLDVSWTLAPATASYVTSSVITATPTGGSSAPVLTATVLGSATSGTVSQLQPTTTYSVTVFNRTAGGTGPAGAPILFTTAASTIPPSAPSIQHIWWANVNLLAVSWQPGSTGDSPTDQYEVVATAVDSDTNPPPADVSVAGSATSAYIALDFAVNWSVIVRAHSAAGWGPWSPAVILPAGD